MVIHNKKKKIALGIVNIFIELLYFPVRLLSKKVSFDNLKPKKILLLRLDHIGDVVMTSPAFDLLKEQYPQAEILLLTSTGGKQLYNNHPAISKLLEFNWPWSYQKSDNKFTFTKISEIWKLIKTLRRERIDLCVDFRGDIRFVILFGVLAGARIRISNSRSGNSSLLHHTISYDHGKHEVERSLEVLSCLVTPGRKYYPQIFLTPEEIKSAKEFITSETGEMDHQKVALIAPYSSQHIKSWPVEHFRDVIRSLVAKDYTVLILGTKEDVGDAKELTAGFPEKVYSAAGKTKIREAAALISIASVIVGVDTGVLHIASCFDTPIVAIFGATRSLEYAPYSQYTTIMDSGCCGCNQFLHMKCDVPVNSFSKCMHELQPATVISGIEECLQKTKPVSEIQIG